MPAKKNRFRDWGWQNATWILALVFAIVNLWLARELSPLAENIRVLQVKVSALESRIDKTDDSLIRIEDKIDQLILRNCE